VSRIVRIFIALVSLVAIVPGIHGLYVHFAPYSFASQATSSTHANVDTSSPFAIIDELLAPFNGTYNDNWTGKIFGIWRPPGVAGDVVERFSSWGLESWFIPAAVLVIGVLLFSNRDTITSTISGIFR
jgi:hypothetical protein